MYVYPKCETINNCYKISKRAGSRARVSFIIHYNFFLIYFFGLLWLRRIENLKLFSLRCFSFWLNFIESVTLQFFFLHITQKIQKKSVSKKENKKIHFRFIFFKLTVINLSSSLFLNFFFILFYFNSLRLCGVLRASLSWWWIKHIYCSLLCCTYQMIAANP